MLAVDMDPDAVPDPSGRADRAIRFLETLTIWEGAKAGEKIKLAPFQKYILKRIYGPCREDGSRMVRTAAIWIPRGNAKTTLAGGLALAHLAGPFAEAGGQIVLAAADRENAGIAYSHSENFAESNPRLRTDLTWSTSKKTIKHPRSKSTLKALSSDVYNKHGLNCSVVIMDEIHAWVPTQARAFYDVLTDSQRKRENPLNIIISTAGAGVGGLSWEIWQYCHHLIDGTHENPSWCPIVLGIDPKDLLPEDGELPKYEWDDEKTWYSVNPGLNHGLLNLGAISEKAEWAKATPVNQSAFKRFTLNIWEEGAPEPWMDMAKYGMIPKGRKEEELLGEPCFLGIDLSSVSDLTSVGAVFRTEDPDGNPRWDVLSHSFLPEENLALKGDQDRAQYVQWVEDGYMTATPGDVVDYRALESLIEEWAEKYGVVEIAYDRWNSSALVTWLLEKDLPMVEYGQGFRSMTAPINEMEAAIRDQRFHHNGNPVLRMCIANIVLVTDPAENKKFTKQKDKVFGRIDAAQAVAMALGRSLAVPGDDRWDLGILVA